MNSKIKDKKLKKKSEFRFHTVIDKTKKGNKTINKHPTFIFLQNGDIYIYVQLTHCKKIRGKIVIKLKRNPNPLDIRESYYIKEILEDNADTFERIRNSWAMDEKDEEEIRKLANKKPYF